MQGPFALGLISAGQLLAPRQMPFGVVGPSVVVQGVESRLGIAPIPYPSEPAAVTAADQGKIYGAFVTGPTSDTLIVAPAQGFFAQTELEPAFLAAAHKLHRRSRYRCQQRPDRRGVRAVAAAGAGRWPAGRGHSDPARQHLRDHREHEDEADADQDLMGTSCRLPRSRSLAGVFVGPGPRRWPFLPRPVVAVAGRDVIIQGNGAVRPIPAPPFDDLPLQGQLPRAGTGVSSYLLLTGPERESSEGQRPRQGWPGCQPSGRRESSAEGYRVLWTLCGVGIGGSSCYSPDCSAAHKQRTAPASQTGTQPA